jgi:hypothetical protein
VDLAPAVDHAITRSGGLVLFTGSVLQPTRGATMRGMGQDLQVLAPTRIHVSMVDVMPQ